MSLARALVKNAKIIILDEATGESLNDIKYDCLLPPSVLASVDYETDRKVQDTIAHEFRDRTILCIARKPERINCLDNTFDLIQLELFLRSPTYDYILRPDMCS